MTPFHVALAAFGVLAVALLVRAWLRRGKNLLATYPMLPGEGIVLEDDVELSSRLRRRAHFTTQVFLAARVRVTNLRVLVAQPALFAPTQRVLRYVIDREGVAPSDWLDGYVLFALASSESGVRAGVLELVPADDAPFLPEAVLLRGPAMPAVAAALGLAAPVLSSANEGEGR